MQIQVLFFATLKSLAGQGKLALVLPEDASNVKDVRTELIRQFPHIEENLQIALTAVNEEFAFDNDAIADGDEVAFFPPVSGGEGQRDDPYPQIFLLPDHPIDHDEIIASITTPATGAVYLFSGMVRGMTQKEGHMPQTQYLEYEAYRPMALAKMRQVADEIRQKWSKVQGIAIAQRVGKLVVGENTVLIACSSGHRDDGCFEAARYGIDRLKEIVPVWKKEIGLNGEAWIEGEYTPTRDDQSLSRS